MQPAKKAARQLSKSLCPAASRSLLDYPAIGDDKINL
jgi:hypothetical protein